MLKAVPKTNIISISDRLQVRRSFIWDPSLVLYLPLYQLAGDAFLSRDAYQHSCTVTGALWTPNGRYFDGDDRITLASTITLFDFTTEDFSVIFWFNPTDFGNDYILNRGFYDIDGWQIQLDSTGRLRFFTNQTDAHQQTYNVTIITAGFWQQFAFTRIGSSVTILKNGEVEAVTAGTHIDPATADRDLDIMRNQLGSMGELLIYNRALTPQEIQHNYLATKWRYL